MMTLRTLQGPFILMAAVLFLCGCDDAAPRASNTNGDQAPNVYRQHSSDQQQRHSNWQPAEDPTVLHVAGLEFTKPATWIESQPLTNLRHSNFSVPGQSGEGAAELAVFIMPDAESVDFELHVQRWQIRFEPDASGSRPKPTRMQLRAGGVDIPAVRLDGAYQKPGAAWFTPGQSLVAAVLLGDGGQVVLRLSGPRSTVTIQEPRFISMIESLREIDSTKQSAQQSSR